MELLSLMIMIKPFQLRKTSFKKVTMQHQVFYFYPNDVVNIAKKSKAFTKRRAEISDTNKVYLLEKRLKVEKLGRGYAWLDTGTHDSLLEASLGSFKF